MIIPKIKSKSQRFFTLTLFLLLTMQGCKNSNINNSGSENVGYDPRVSSQLKTIHYNTIRLKLLVNFGLDENTSPAIALLNSFKGIFETADLKYSATYGTFFIKIMNLACGETTDDTLLFPNGSHIDFVWKSLTGRTADSDAKKMETDILSKMPGESPDKINHALCLAAATSAEAMFSNYVRQD